jgi:hypothetical protein
MIKLSMVALMATAVTTGVMAEADIKLGGQGVISYASIQPNLIKILIQKQNKYKEGFSKF